MAGLTTGKPTTDDDSSDLVGQLRDQLLGKDELIAALIAELEQVVEQLDRAKRNGDRPRPGAPGAGLPPEVVEEHQQVLSDLQRVVQQWEELQAASLFGRIESELSELRTLVAHGNVAPGHSQPHSADSPTDLEEVMSRLGSDSGNLDEPGAAAWETMKRQMLDQGESDHEPGDDDSLTKLLDGITTPEPIDVDTASVETLKRACADRDTYIVQLIRWIRSRRPVTVPENWEELADVPEELRQQVEQLASRLEEQVRLAEVEMSLERARLSREKSQLQAERATLDKHLKRLGIASLDELENIAVSSSSSGDRRWMRFLGVNRKS